MLYMYIMRVVFTVKLTFSVLPLVFDILIDFICCTFYVLSESFKMVHAN